MRSTIVALGLSMLLSATGFSLADGQAGAGNRAVGKSVGLTFQNFFAIPAGQPFTVPDGVYYLTVDARGGHGGGSLAHAPAGGAAGVVDTVVPVTPGQGLTVYVGEYGRQAGGWGFTQGAAGGKLWSGSGAWEGQGGGGSTGITTGPDGEITLVVAGGGGGAGGDDEEQAWGGQGGYGGRPAQGGLDGHFQGGGPNGQGLVGGCGGCVQGGAGEAGYGTTFIDGAHGGGGGGGGGGWQGGGGGDSGSYPTGTSPQVASVGGSGGGGGSSWVTGSAFDTKYTVSASECDGGDHPGMGCDGMVTLTWGQPPQSVATYAGDGQKVTVGLEFAPIAVRVTDAAGVPVPGVDVDFTLPASGPSGVFFNIGTKATVTTGPLGVATVPPMYANTVSGGWTAEASVAGLPGKARFSLSNLAAETKTVLSASPDPSRFGQPIEFSALVSTEAIWLPPTGLVQFTIDGAPAGYPRQVGSDGRAVLPASEVPPLGPGTHAVEARYLGDAGHSGSAAERDQVVERIPAAVTVDADPSPSSVGEDVTVKAEIAGAEAPTGPPTGTVAFTAGAATLGVAPVGAGGAAEIVTDELPLGETAIEAAYSGDAAYEPGSGSVIHAVGPEATATQVSSSSNPAVWGSPIVWKATVRRSDQGQALAGAIEFGLDGQTICPAAPIPAGGIVQCSPQDPPDAGSHRVTAHYDPPLGSSDLASHGTAVQIVTRAQTRTEVTVDPEPSTFGQATGLGFEVTAGSPAPPSGLVQLSVDGTEVGSAQVPAGGRGTIEERCAPQAGACPFLPGSHVLEGLFTPAGDNLYPSHGASVHWVGPAATTISLRPNRDPVPQNEPLVLESVVAGPDGLGTPGGRVQFLVDGQAVGDPVSLSAGTARSLPIEGLHLGAHATAARYLGTDAFAPAETEAEQQVGPPDEEFGPATLRLLPSRARVDRQGTVRLRATCTGRPGATCRLRATLRTSRKVRFKRGRGRATRPAGTALATRAVRIPAGAVQPIRFDLSNLGGLIVSGAMRVPALVRAVPEPGTAQMKAHPVRLLGSKAPAMTVRRTGSARKGRLRLGVRCRGGDGGPCVGPLTVRGAARTRLARRWVRLPNGAARTVKLRVRRRSMPASVRVRAESRIRVGRDRAAARVVRIR